MYLKILRAVPNLKRLHISGKVDILVYIISSHHMTSGNTYKL